MIELYDAGGRNEQGEIAPGRDSEIRPLGLSEQEKSDLIAFLCALSSHPDSPGNRTDRTVPVLPGKISPGRARPDSKSFLRTLYPDLLSRSPDAEGFAFYIGQLEQGRSRAEVVDDFLTSNEYLEKLVTEGYREYFERTPDSGGLAFYRERLRSTEDLHDFYFQLASSAEYRALHLYWSSGNATPDLSCYLHPAAGTF